MSVLIQEMHSRNNARRFRLLDVPELSQLLLMFDQWGRWWIKTPGPGQWERLDPLRIEYPLSRRMMPML